MNALHYAVFFDCEEVVELLCKHNPGKCTCTSTCILFYFTIHLF